MENTPLKMLEKRLSKEHFQKLISIDNPELHRFVVE